MTSNNNINNTFDKGLKSLREVTLAPDKKGALFKSLLAYAEAHPPVKQGVWAAAFRLVKGFIAIGK